MLKANGTVINIYLEILVSKSPKLRQTQPDKKKCHLLRQKGNKTLMC